MKFTSKTDQQIAEDNLIREGFYLFEVTKAEEKKSSKGDDMIELTMKMLDANGRERTVKDWLVESFAKKFKHFFSATGLTEKYESGELSESDCIGVRGKLELVIAPDKKGVLRNSVKDYILTSDAEKTVESNDDVPF